MTFAQRQTEFTGGLGEVKPIRRVTLNHHFSAKPSSSSSACAGPALSQSSLYKVGSYDGSDGRHSESGDCTVMAWLTSGKSHENEDRIAEMAESDCLVEVKL